MAEVYVDSWRAGYAGYFPAAYLAGMSVDQAAARWRSALADPRPGVINLVATEETDNEAALGLVQCGPTRESPEDFPDLAQWGEITMLYVSPQTWQRGIGGDLLDRATGALRAAGLTPVHLWALDGNHRTERFYRRFGWTKTDRVKTDDSRGFPIAEALWTLDENAPGRQQLPGRSGQRPPAAPGWSRHRPRLN